MFPPKSDCSGELSWHRNKNLDLSPTDFESSCASADSSSSNFSEIAKTRSEVSDSKIQRHDEIRNSPRLPTRSLPDKVHCLPKSSSHEKLQGKIYQESGVFSKNQESSCLVAGNKLAPQPWGHRRMGSLPSDSRPRLKFAKSFSDRTIGHSKESKYYYDNRTEEDGKIKNQTKTKNRPASNSVDASVPSSAIILPLCTKKTKQRVSHMSAAPRPLHGSLHSTGTYFCGKGVINIDKIFEKPRPAPLPSNFVHDEAHQ
ncbi:hypothetical protein BY996DRAFT_6937634 [Phakopsora pachyrhizi]|nr:hypothetical protein BY996DRAFT_6937634 [Phakopsora pachyrhizi]